MGRKDTLINKALCICVEAKKSLEKQPIKPGSSKDKLYSECMSLIRETDHILEQAKEENSAELLEVGLNNLFLLDLKMQKMKNRYRPDHELYLAIVKYAMENHTHDVDNFHGVMIPIPFPTPEKFLAFVKQLFSDRGI